MSVVEDKLEILDLIARYSHAYDGDDSEAWANVFTEDGVVNGRVGQPDEIVVRGRDQLLAFHRRAVSRRGRSQTRHHQSTTMFVELTENRAVTRTYLLVTHVEEGKPPFVGLTSVYEDEIVRTPAGWRIKVRRILPDVKGVLADVLRRAPAPAEKGE